MGGGHDIVVVGASAGGVEALRAVVENLPGDLNAAVFVVLHLAPSGTSVLPQILERAGRLRAVHASDGEKFERSVIYIAPPDRHMRFSDGRVMLDRGPRENGHRPAVDPMFRSAAETFGGRVIGVVLSGVLDDGAAGLVAVKEGGGATLVQSASDALYATMPSAALAAVGEATFTGSAREVARAIVELIAAPAGPAPPPVADPSPEEEALVEIDRGSSEHPQPGDTSGFTCPECHGALWETRNGNMLRFRCRTGHEYSPESLLAVHADHVERALWAALRALEEKAALLRRMAVGFTERGQTGVSMGLEEKANGVFEEALTLRKILRSIERPEEALGDAGG